MPKMLRFTPEFKDQSVRLLFAEIGPDPVASRPTHMGCQRLTSPLTPAYWGERMLS